MLVKSYLNDQSNCVWKYGQWKPDWVMILQIKSLNFKILYWLFQVMTKNVVLRFLFPHRSHANFRFASIIHGNCFIFIGLLLCEWSHLYIRASIWPELQGDEYYLHVFPALVYLTNSLFLFLHTPFQSLTLCLACQKCLPCWSSDFPLTTKIHTAMYGIIDF